MLINPQVTSLIRSFPSTVSVYTSAKPSPFSLDASVSRILGSDGSKLIRTRWHVRICTSASKESCRSKDHIHFFSFFSRWRSGSDAWVRSGMKPASCFASPRKDLSSWMFCGLGNSLRAIALSGHGLIAPCLTTYPANATSLLILNFFMDQVMPIALHISKIV
jgi:hypothetical protein